MAIGVSWVWRDLRVATKGVGPKKNTRSRCVRTALMDRRGPGPKRDLAARPRASPVPRTVNTDFVFEGAIPSIALRKCPSRKCRKAMSRSPNHPPAPNQHKLGNNAAAASVPVPEEQSPAQLATLLATAYAENENLRRDSQITQRRAEKAERMLESFSGDPNRDGPARAVQQAEARAEKAELQRDEAEAQLRRVLDEWHRLDEYLNDAEVKLMAARKGIGAVLQSSRSGALRYADQMHRAESPYQQQGMPPPHHQRGMVPPLPPLRRRVEEAEGAPPSKRSRSTRDYAEVCA